MSASRASEHPRTSQRQPRACLECTRRKIRCDKQSPCGRCIRLSKPCTREVVRISKAETVHRSELDFLDGLSELLASSQDINAAQASIQTRRSLLLYGTSPATTGCGPTNVSPTTNVQPRTGVSPGDSSSRCVEEPATDGSTSLSAQSPLSESSPGQARDKGEEQLASKFHKIEWLAWGRHRGDCFPHFRCQCRSVRPYAEVVSIIANPEWPGLRLTSAKPCASLLVLPVDQARHLVHFHLRNILWHHTVFHAPTFLLQCERFWTSNKVVHPLWLSLYYSVIMVSAWTALNCTGLWDGGSLDPLMPMNLFSAMVNQLYQEDFAQNHSLFSIQAIVLSTRVAHNLDQTDLNAVLVGAAIRIAHCMGLHKIMDHQERPPVSTLEGWFQSIEIEVGRRCWNQLVIQDYFQISVTETYLIHPSQYATELPINCHDEDMIPRGGHVITISSYPRTLSRIASLMPQLLDSLGPARKRSLNDAYKVVLTCDAALRQVIREMPSFWREVPTSQPENEGESVSWLPVARRSLALSAADKLIMIYRPILYHAFQVPALTRVRKCCLAAAQTIFREHASISQEGVIPIWTHSAFCVTAAVVVGLELMFRERHTDDEARDLRSMMTTTAERLRSRQCDIIAERCAALIDTVLAVEEELVIKVMRLSSSRQEFSLLALQTAMVNDMVSGNELMAKFIALRPDSASPYSLREDMSQINDDLLADPSWAAYTSSNGSTDPDLMWLNSGEFSFLNVPSNE